MVTELVEHKAGRPKGSYYKLEEREKAKELLLQGKGIREVARQVGIASQTVRRVRDEIRAQLPKECECGRPLGHKGWCKGRVRESPARQETLRKMHEGTREVVQHANGNGTGKGQNRREMIREMIRELEEAIRKDQEALQALTKVLEVLER